MNQKRCTKCDVIKDVKEFAKSKSCKDGFNYWCKECFNNYYNEHKEESLKYQKRYYKEYKAEVLKQHKRYNEEHKEEISKRVRKYTEEHKEEISKWQKSYREGHREEISKYKKKYRKDHRVEFLKWKKKYRDVHKEEIAASLSKYRKTENGRAVKKRTNHKRRALTKNIEVSLTTEQWVYIIKKQNNRCNVCGKKFNAKRPATQDHIIPVMHNGSYSSDNIQALCKSCNSTKHSKLDPQFIQTWNHDTKSLSDINHVGNTKVC